MPVCIYSREVFDQSTGEHILQNSLGARWTSNQIVCNRLQQEFAGTIDAALERGLQPIRNLLGTPGGRGGQGPTLRGLNTTAGERINLQPGGQPQLAAPVVDIEQLGNGQYRIGMRVGRVEDLPWALTILRNRLPNIRADLAMVQEAARGVEGLLAGQVHLQVGIGGLDYFRGLLKACLNLVGVTNPNIALSPACDQVRTFVESGVGDSQNFARWIPDPDNYQPPTLGPADQFIGIAGVRRGIEGLVQLFGQIKHSIRLSSNFTGEPFRVGYLVNPFRDTNPSEVRNPDFAPALIPDFAVQIQRPVNKFGRHSERASAGYAGSTSTGRKAKSWNERSTRY
jgi:hypothetical protein